MIGSLILPNLYLYRSINSSILRRPRSFLNELSLVILTYVWPTNFRIFQITLITIMVFDAPATSKDAPKLKPPFKILCRYLDVGLLLNIKPSCFFIFIFVLFYLPDLNPSHLVLDMKALSTVPQPLPRGFKDRSNKYNLQGKTMLSSLKTLRLTDQIFSTSITLFYGGKFLFFKKSAIPGLFFFIFVFSTNS